MKINNGFAPSLSLTRRIEVSPAEFEAPSPPEFETVSLADPSFREWLRSPQGRTDLARDLCRRVEEHEVKTGESVICSESLNGEGYVDAERRRHLAFERVEEGVARSSAETVYFRDFGQGHDGLLASRRRTEVHCSPGTIVILEYASADQVHFTSESGRADSKG